MAVSHIKAVFPVDVETIWNLVTNLEDYSWRSDLSRLEVLAEGKFAEYTKDGFMTMFTITAEEPCRRWEFEMENDNMSGRWIGVFSREGSGTAIDFTEEVTAKKWFMKPFVKSFLKKQQAAYVRDLEKALQSREQA